MEKKYRLTDETIEYCTHTLHRIEALIDFGDVKKGYKGGWVANEENLSHDGDCWIYGRAMVFEDAKVSGDAEISDRAKVYGKAEISGKALITEKSIIYEDAKVFGKAIVFGEAQILGSAIIYGESRISGDTKIFGDAIITDKAQVYGAAKILEKAVITGDIEIEGDAVIKSINDYIVFKNFWSSGRYFIYTKSNKMWKVGCFHGTGKELIQKAYKDSEVSGKNYERFVKFVENLEKELENDLNDK